MLHCLLSTGVERGFSRKESPLTGMANTRRLLKNKCELKPITATHRYRVYEEVIKEKM